MSNMLASAATAMPIGVTTRRMMDQDGMDARIAPFPYAEQPARHLGWIVDELFQGIKVSYRGNFQVMLP